MCSLAVATRTYGNLGCISFSAETDGFTTVGRLGISKIAEAEGVYDRRVVLPFQKIRGLEGSSLP
jgi:hypothetical protein